MRVEQNERNAISAGVSALPSPAAADPGECSFCCSPAGERVSQCPMELPPSGLLRVRTNTPMAMYGAVPPFTGQDTRTRTDFPDAPPVAPLAYDQGSE
jgi:hypothetical protein